VRDERADPGDRDRDEPAKPGPNGPAEAPDERLLAVASRILEGEPIDWEALPREPEPGGARALQPQLRLLESLSRFNRSVQRSGSGANGEPDPERWGHLEIIERIGRGSFADVYHARDPRLERDVALKLLRLPSEDPTPQGEQVIREARLLAKVCHPSVVTVHGADIHDGRVGIWMEMVQGDTLWSLVRQRGPLGAGEIAAIGHELLGALAAVHAAGVLHGDLKAQNVMRAEGGRIVLMDFGIARDLTARREDDADLVFGTALYAAPERLRGAEATVRSELYSLGVLLFYLATGSFPVVADSLHELIACHDRGERVYLRDRRPDLPRPLIDVIERALAPAPGDRPESAGEMDLALTAAPAARRATRRLPASRVRLVAGIVAVPVLGALALGLALQGRYSIEATLYRGLPDGGQRALSAADEVAVNDQVFLEVQSTRDMYVYVVNRDLSGDMTLLFPHPQLDQQNPLSGKSIHRLPGRLGETEVDWKISTDGGREQFLIIASPQRLTDLEANIKDLDRPGYAAVSAEALVRGVKEFAAAPGRASAPGADATERIFREAQPLGHGRESTRGAWVRKLELTSE
jgi:tRNA A-37 threonylcarbamoyl transferase component Bud32